MGFVDTVSIAAPAPIVKRRHAALAVALDADPSDYVGVDRRSGLEDTANTRVLVPILALIASVWLLAEVAIATGKNVTPVDAQGLGQFLDASLVTLSTVVALLAFVRWRLTGEARPLLVAAGAVAFGPVAIGMGSILPTIVGSGSSGLAGIRTTGTALAGAALIAAAVWPQIDTRLKSRSLVGGVPIAAALLGLLTMAVPALDGIAGGAPLAFTLALLMGTAAALHAQTARSFDRATHETIAVAAVALALAQISVAHVPGGTAAATALVGAAVLQTAAFVLLVGRGMRDLEIAFVTQRARLLETEIGMETETARHRAQEMAREERDHDARNSLLAIEGASVALERYRDRLAPERRTQLADAVTDEIARLQRLISGEGGRDIEFAVAEIVQPVLEAEASRGLEIEFEIEEGLIAFGRPAETIEVMRNLLSNARNYAPESAVTVRAIADGDWAVVYVEDRGRGIARTERETIFGRGQRGAAATGTDGSGLGLFVSRRLMQDQGGDVWAENRTGGGASFGFCLPRTPRPAQCAEVGGRS